MAGMLDELWEQLQGAAHGLARVAPKKLFGCEGLFAGTQIFAMVWKEGRLAVRIPDPDAYAECLAQAGAEPWAPGRDGKKRVMAHWVLLPEELHDEPEQVGAWVARAHALAMAGKAPTVKPKKKPPAAKKKPPAAKKKPPAAKKKR